MTSSVDDELSQSDTAEAAPPSSLRGGVGRFLLFGVIGLSGFVPNLSCMFVLTSILDVHYVLATVLATQVAIAWNFLLLERFVYLHVRTEPRYRRALAFLALNNADLVLRIPLLAALVEGAHMNCLVATVVTLVAMFVVRFVVTDRVIYRLRRGLRRPS